MGQGIIINNFNNKKYSDSHRISHRLTDYERQLTAKFKNVKIIHSCDVKNMSHVISDVM